ncbi:hypothetical protein AS589_14705 [Empedobacter brevis]|nr:hypothetical protein AS589_14705 [Empedobacter brevis]
MKRKNSILRYSGLLFLIVGIILNIRMFAQEAWPTYLFFIICIIGLVQIIISFITKQLKISWQIFWVFFPFILSIILLKIIG